MRSLVGGIVVTACLALGACGGSTDPEQPQAPAPTTDTPSTDVPTAPDPTLTAKPPSGAQELAGSIERGVEARCLVLSVSSGQSYVLTGTVAGLEPGDRVTVKGRSDPGAATTCQQGPVFEVTEIVDG
ncbi:hypothetical protein [Aeromicrobium sp. CF3.5]|uniref:hypothetical protein n=1 Tax=Aeromicrobium sp. CF3.5 TaxID=3373078 RepID=UPI003EE6B561